MDDQEFVFNTSTLTLKAWIETAHKEGKGPLLTLAVLESVFVGVVMVTAEADQWDDLASHLSGNVRSRLQKVRSVSESGGVKPQ